MLCFLSDSGLHGEFIWDIETVPEKPQKQRREQLDINRTAEEANKSFPHEQ